MSGMLANARLPRPIADVGFHEVRRQLQYKGQRYGMRIVLAYRGYPSSKLCSGCGARNGDPALASAPRPVPAEAPTTSATSTRRSTSTGALAARPALPEASLAVTPGAAARRALAGGGKVTPISYQHGRKDGSR